MAGISKCESPAPNLPATPRPKPWDLQLGYLIRESISASPKCNVWTPPHPTQKLKIGEILQGFWSILARNKCTLDTLPCSPSVCIAVPLPPPEPALLPGPGLSQALPAESVPRSLLLSTQLIPQRALPCPLKSRGPPAHYSVIFTELLVILGAYLVYSFVSFSLWKLSCCGSRESYLVVSYHILIT